MILTFVALTNAIEKVPVWSCANGKNGNKFSCFISTPAFPKRIMLLGPNAQPPYAASDITEVRPGIFVSKMELPYTDLCVAGDDLRPFIGTFDPKAPHKNVVVIQIDRTVYTYLCSGVGPSKDALDTDSVIVNTFHAKDWVGCIAVIGEDFERGNYDPPRMVGMYIDYAIRGESRSKMLHEMHIKGNPKGISITDGLVDGKDTPKRLMAILNAGKKQAFRIRTTQRLSNLVIVPEGMKNAKAVFDELPADYLDNPYDLKIMQVPVDKDGVVIETDDVRNDVLSIFEKKTNNHNRSVIFYDCRPSSAFFNANLSYMFIAGTPKKKGGNVSYFSTICP